MLSRSSRGVLLAVGQALPHTATQHTTLQTVTLQTTGFRQVQPTKLRDSYPREAFKLPVALKILAPA